MLIPIPIDFDKVWSIDVFVLFTTSLRLTGTKKASSRGQEPLGGFILEPSENPIDNRRQTAEIGRG
jgi:hypothetical protein